MTGKTIGFAVPTIGLLLVYTALMAVVQYKDEVSKILS